MGHLETYGWDKTFFPRLAQLPASAPSSDADYILRRSQGVHTWEVAGTAPTVRAIEVENDTAFDANQAAGVRSVWSSTNQIMVAGSGFTVAAAGITVPVAGVYRFTCNLYMTPGAARTNCALRASINGTAQRARAAHAYIRAASGHNESSLNLSCLLSLSASDVVGCHTAQLSSSASAMTVAVGQGTMGLEYIGAV